jgi:hypothetical protein
MVEPLSTELLPQYTLTEDGNERCVGVEIELGGLDGADLAAVVARVFDGKVEEKTMFDYRVINTRFGNFKLELDSAYLKKLASESASASDVESDDLQVNLRQMGDQIMSFVAQQLVPWEVVAPPTPISELSVFAQLLSELRCMGAKGTRHAVHFAFGVHLNPELPALDSQTILNYLQAYCCLYDWLVEKEDIDFSRRTTPYINHYDEDYVRKVIDRSYHPEQPQLIDDYVEANPTRNRGLDMLPLFAFLDEERVLQALDDERIQSRPTLHYRLPDCDIDNPKWGLTSIWSNWLQVERLAADTTQLDIVCTAYREHLQQRLPFFGDSWVDRCQNWVTTGALGGKPPE